MPSHNIACRHIIRTPPLRFRPPTATPRRYASSATPDTPSKWPAAVYAIRTPAVSASDCAAAIRKRHACHATWRMQFEDDASEGRRTGRGLQRRKKTEKPESEENESTAQPRVGDKPKQTSYYYRGPQTFISYVSTTSEEGVAKLPSERVATPDSGFVKDLLTQRLAGIWLPGPLGCWSVVCCGLDAKLQPIKYCAVFRLAN